MQGSHCLDRFVERPTDHPDRFDGAHDEQIRPVSHRAAGSPVPPEVGDDPNDAAVVGVPSCNQLREETDLARRPVVHHGTVEPRQKDVRRAQAFDIDAEHFGRREFPELAGLFVWDEAVEPFAPKPHGSSIEPTPLCVREQWPRQIDPHVSKGNRGCPRWPSWRGWRDRSVSVNVVRPAGGRLP